MISKDFKVDACQSNFYVMLKQLLFLYDFYDLFFDEPTVL